MKIKNPSLYKAIQKAVKLADAAREKQEKSGAKNKLSLKLAKPIIDWHRPGMP
jgi:hypothetical protein